MAKAIEAKTRRRAIQLEYNEKHRITPQPIIKKVSQFYLSWKLIMAAEYSATGYSF